ncbi:MAG: integrase, partial [Archaeoglobaceae archaeon]
HFARSNTSTPFIEVSKTEMRRPGFEPGAGARQAFEAKEAIKTEKPETERKTTHSKVKEVEGIILVEGIDLKTLAIDELGAEIDKLKPITQEEIKKLKDSGKAQGFLKYMFSKDTGLKAIQQMISAMQRLLPDDIITPEDLEDVEATKHLIRFLQNFFTYLEEKKGIDKINGFNLKAWRSGIPKEETGIEEIYPSDQDVIEAFNKCPEQIKPYFKLLMYSGMRLAQVVRALNNFDESRIIIDGNVGKYPLGYISKGKKLGYWLFFPAKFADKLTEMAKKPYAYDHLVKELKIGKITAKRLRKWHANFLIRHDIDTEIVDYIQGRASLKIGSTHYFDMTKRATERYAKVVDKFPIEP